MEIERVIGKYNSEGTISKVLGHCSKYRNVVIRHFLCNNDCQTAKFLIDPKRMKNIELVPFVIMHVTIMVYFLPFKAF